MDPLDFDVTASDGRTLRVHKRTCQLGIVANDALNLVKIKVHIADDAADDPAPPRRRVLGKSSSSALYHKDGVLLKGTPLPTPQATPVNTPDASKAASDADSNV